MKTRPILFSLRTALTTAMLLAAVVATAQSPEGKSWRQLMDEMGTLDDMGEEDGTGRLADCYELLEQLADHPIELNSATRDDLEQLPFLSAQQVMDIEEYLYRYGPMRSIGELRMVRSLDYRQLSLLPFFVYVADRPISSAPQFPRVDSLLRHARQTLTATARVPLYRRKGNENGYLGYQYRHSLRYELTSGQWLRAGLVGAQDAGEPFLAGNNSWGYDFYSFYIQVRGWRRLTNLVAGRYRLTAGMGLALGQSFQLGKLATLQSMGRSVTVLRPHSSRSEADYFQGVAATVSLLSGGSSRSEREHSLLLTPFISYRPVDATLNNSGDAQTLLYSGYHRTPTEMKKKHNTHLTSGGLHIAYSNGPLRLGATAVATTLDRQLSPQRKTLYRRYYAHGRHFANMSVDYAYTHYRLAVNGETATNEHGSIATANALSVRVSPRLWLMALQRFYSYRYTSLYGHGFGESASPPQNESGIYVGATWNPVAHLQLQGYADYAHFAWARYLVSKPSNSTDLLLQATYRLGHWTLLGRHRSHLKQRDNKEKTALTANDQHRQRLAVSYQDERWSLTTQFDHTRAFYLKGEDGWMVSQQATFTTAFSRERGLLLSAMAAYFHTDSYQSRIYVYERQLQHEFYFPTYYGHGLRAAFLARTDLTRRLRLSARVGHTCYFDRSVISSGLQQINHSYQTDLDFQLRWKF